MKLIISSNKTSARLIGSPARLLSVANSLTGDRDWMPKGAGIILSPSEGNVSRLRAFFPDMVIEHAALGQGEEFDIPATRPTYRTKLPPMDHQKRAMEKSRGKPAFFLLMEQGTGKTKVGIDEAGELWSAGKIDAVLVLSKKGVHKQWIASQVPEHFGAPWEGAYWNGSKFVVVKTKAVGERCIWCAINWDAIKFPKGFKAAEDFVKQHRGRIMIIGDETQEIKTASSARYKAATALRKLAAPKKVIAMTGTPIAKDLTDEWAQLKWLDPDILGINYKGAFQTEFCIMGGFEGKSVVGSKNMARFRSKVDPFSFRATQEELGLLPPNRRRWTFELSLEQKTLIRRIREGMQTSSQDKMVEAAVALLRMQQVGCGFHVTEDGTRILDKNPRVEALLEVLDAYPGKAIVWHRFNADATLIREALAKAGESAVFYSGETSSKDRDEALDSFLSSQGARVLVANPQAAGTGLNLQVGGCLHAIYYSNSFRAIDRWQSEYRIQRIGTIGQVVYTDLVAKGGVIDQMILSNLKRKKGISELAIGEIRDALDKGTAEEWDYEIE